MGITFYGAFADDAFTRFMKALALIGSLVTLLLSLDFMRARRIARVRIPGADPAVDARHDDADLGRRFHRALSRPRTDEPRALRDRRLSPRRLRATEAGLKYFVLGALSSGMLLYGVSLIYGYSGTVSFPGIAAAVHGHRSIGVVFGLVFVLAGLAFKISAVPFHMWTPDVYEGAPTPVTTFFASAPKIAAMAVLVRVDAHRLSRHRQRMAADHRLHLDRLDGARRLRRDRADQHQAADGLFARSATWASRSSASRPARSRACMASSSTWRSMSS